MSSRGRNQLWISLREMRIAKMERRSRVKPCEAEFESFLSSQGQVGAGRDVPSAISQALEDCLRAADNAPRPIDMKRHLQKFTRYDK